MIRGFRRRALRRLYENDDRRAVSAEHVEMVTRVMARLDVATQPNELNLPGFQLRRLEGELTGCWSITIRGNWGIIFRFNLGNATDVDLVEYH
jgi:toxin HigB-1